MSEGELETQEGKSKFGNEWETLEAPVTAIIGIVDDSGEEIPEARIGLSAKQLKNLGLERLDEKRHGAHWLKRLIMRNTEGLTDDEEYPMVVVGFHERQVNSRVYNAFGKLNLVGSNIRVSKELIEALGAEVGSEVEIDRLIGDKLPDLIPLQRSPRF